MTSPIRRGAVMLTLTLGVAWAGPRDQSWANVDTAIHQKLPKTALAEIDPIIAAAIAKGAWGEAAKGIGHRIMLEGNPHGNLPADLQTSRRLGIAAAEKITRLEAEIAEAPAPLKPLLRVLEANWYWHYFVDHRREFALRTPTDTKPGDESDFTTWALPRILAEIDRQFQLALAAEEALKATPVADYTGLLEAGTVADTYRPTLFDILAHNALEFYAAAEQAGLMGEPRLARSEDAFALLADSPIFAPTAEFLKWRPDSADTTSPLLRAIVLYQRLLAIHQNDTDRTAFADADRARLSFGYNYALGDDTDERYLVALERFCTDWAASEVCALALNDWACLLQAKGEKNNLAAHELARRGAALYPQSIGGQLCRKIVQQLESRECQITTESVWNAPWPELQISYRNISTIHFRAIACDFETHLAANSRTPEAYHAMLTTAPTLAWSAELPPTPDLQRRQQLLPAPKDLKPGFYFIIASGDTSFARENNQLSYASVWVSDLMLLNVRECSKDGKSARECLLVNAITGEPEAQATVTCWTRDKANFTITAEARTDANGIACIEVPEYGVDLPRTLDQRYLLLARKGDHAIVSEESSAVARREAEPQTVRNQIVFFTDRELYRPGQVIFFKGICYRADNAADKYGVMANRDVTVKFMDANQSEIAKLQLRSNDYGSFSGSFTAPRDRLTGRMSLMVEDEGSVAITVEEYRRPTFGVTLEQPEAECKLGTEATVTGLAVAYTGAPVDGAKVSYRVVRQWSNPSGRFVRHYGWYVKQEVARGTVRTGADGTFAVAFVAKAAPGSKTETMGSFTVYVDVTDAAGETHSDSRTVLLGSHQTRAMRTSLEFEDWQVTDKPVELSITTRLVDRTPPAAAGQLVIYRIPQPDTVERPSLFKGDFSSSYRGEAIGFRWSKSMGSEAEQLAATVATQAFATDNEGKAKLSFSLPAGLYRAVVETTTPVSPPAMVPHQFLVVDPAARHFNVRVPFHAAAATSTLEPGATFSALWGTGYPSGRAYVEIWRRGVLLKRWWTAADRTQALIEWPVTESLRGGFTVRLTFVHENRLYTHDWSVQVPWSNKQLNLTWEHFVSRLGPGQKETWTAVLRGPEAGPTAGEMVATLYDASLDSYQMPRWWYGFNCYPCEDHNGGGNAQGKSAALFQTLGGGWPYPRQDVNLLYRHFPAFLTSEFWNYARLQDDGAGWGGMAHRYALSAYEATGEKGEAESLSDDARAKAAQDTPRLTASEGDAQTSGAGAVDLHRITTRKNLNETAFFLPHLVAGADGAIRMEFTMPETLTRWKFLAFAHDRELREGTFSDAAITAKELMVEPHPPRFVREGDVLEFTVKVINLSANRQAGTVRLTFADAQTQAPQDARLGHVNIEQAFDIPALATRSFSWRISVPDATAFLIYKAVAASERLSDGEEGWLPVLSRRCLVQESLPLALRHPGTKTFTFAKLSESGKSLTLAHQALTVQMVSQPAWYAILALPYLMEAPNDCREQTFNHFFATALAQQLADSDPKVRKVFEQWQDTPARDQPLEANADLKAIILAETPWIRAARSENEARRDRGALFDAHRLMDESARALQKLKDAQLADGLWPWLPGGCGDTFISLYILAGFGRLHRLGADIDNACVTKALKYFDRWAVTTSHGLQQRAPQTVDERAFIPMYLYARSFFLTDQPLAGEVQTAVNDLLDQARNSWLTLDCLQSEAQLALVLKRFGDRETPLAIMKSIAERAVTSEEMGMYWRQPELTWGWSRAPIETQAVVIEAFAEVMDDAAAVDACTVWLLKQKQTQGWATTKATADAVYALLLHHRKALVSDARVGVALAGQTLKPENVEAGTGVYEKRFSRDEIKPDMGRITVTKTDAGVAWGSVHWQYLEELASITPSEGTPFRLKKGLFIRVNTPAGPVLKPVQGALAVGDELVVRLELRADRDMEYVHLKDQRGSGTEPENVLSVWRYQDGLAYYESTRDTASHFFISHLPKGVYVFEYSARLAHRGTYQTGIASIQSMYAPEFSSHSESLALHVE